MTFKNTAKKGCLSWNISRRSPGASTEDKLRNQEVRESYATETSATAHHTFLHKSVPRSAA